MKVFGRHFVVVSAILLSACTAGRHADNGSMVCAEDQRVVAPCYAVHGKIMLGANMRPRLRPEGGRRLLGIIQKSEAVDLGYYWPPAVEKILDYDTDISGDFYVCPFSPDEPGKMRFVCIESADNLKKKPSHLGGWGKRR